MTLLKMYKKKERKKVKKKKKILEYSFSDFEITSAPYHFEQIPTPFPVNSNIEQKGLINRTSYKDTQWIPNPACTPTGPKHPNPQPEHQKPPQRFST